MIKYAVVIEPLTREPWTECYKDSFEEAWDRRQSIQANIRNLRVTIKKVEVGKEGEDG